MDLGFVEIITDFIFCNAELYISLSIPALGCAHVILPFFKYLEAYVLLTFLCITASQVMHLDAEKEMMSQCVALLGKFIAVREPNIRYSDILVW